MPDVKLGVCPVVEMLSLTRGQLVWWLTARSIEEFVEEYVLSSKWQCLWLEQDMVLACASFHCVSPGLSKHVLYRTRCQLMQN